MYGSMAVDNVEMYKYAKILSKYSTPFKSYKRFRQLMMDRQRQTDRQTNQRTNTVILVQTCGLCNFWLGPSLVSNHMHTS